MEKHVSRAERQVHEEEGRAETLEEHIEAGGALMFVACGTWRVRLRVTRDVRPADYGISGVLGGRADPYCVVKYQGKKIAASSLSLPRSLLECF